MPYTQDNRSIAIATPLGKDKLLLNSCTISEQLGRPFVVKAQLLSEEPAIDFLELIGKGVTIRWRMPDLEGGEKKRHFSGYVSSFLQRPRAEGLYNYEATIVPWLWFLTRTADCRIFHSAMSQPPDEMTVPGILKKVFKDHGFDDVTPALTATYRKLDHCVQYRETDFNFVSRLMEQEGIYYFFEHVDDSGVIKHKLKLVDAMSAHPEYPDYGTIKYRVSANEKDDKGSILFWSRIKQVQPGTYKVNDFDFKRPKTSLLGSGTQDRQHSNSAFEIYDFAANFADEEPEDHGDDYGKVRIEELQAQHDIIVGQSDCPGVACGSKFTLEGHPREDENGEYLIVGVTYRCTAEAYKTAGAQGLGSAEGTRFSCDFTAIPADSVFRPARITVKPRIYGPQTAMVVGPAGEEIHTDEFGRIKVQFHWDRYSPANENSPCWVRVSQLWAGKNWGAVFLPRIGQEVIVEFLDGNPDRPIVTGAVYNGESKPPYPLPDNATMSTIKSNSSKGGQGFNEIRFEDKKGSEQVFMHAEKDQDIRVKNDTKEWIGKDRHLIVKAKQIELVEGDKHGHVKGDQLLKVDGDIGTTVAGNEITKVGGNQHASVTGAHHLKTTGDIRLTAAGGADVKASQNAAVEAGLNVHVKGGMVVVIEAGIQLSLKAGANFIDIGPAGISIQGTMVNINMGGAAGSGSGAQAASPESPDAPGDAAEAAKAEPGSSDTKQAPTPPTPKKFSPSALAMQQAAQAGAPLIEPAADSPADTAATAATTANAAAVNATTAAVAATAAASAATTAAATTSNSAAAAAATAAGSAAAAASTAASEAAQAATQAAQAATEAAEEAKEAVEKAKEVADKAEEEVKEAAEKAQEAADQATEAAKEAAEKGTEEAKEAAEKAKERADKAQEAADQAKDAAKDATDKANDAAIEAADKAEAATAAANQAANTATVAAAAANTAAANASAAAPASPSLPNP